MLACGALIVSILEPSAVVVSSAGYDGSVSSASSMG